MALQLAMYYVSFMHMHITFNTAWWCHWARDRAHFGPQKYWFPRLTTGRSRITSTVIYYLVRSFVYLAYNSSINSSCIGHVARHKKHENFWITSIRKISTAKILILCLTVKYTCRDKFRVYGTSFWTKDISKNITQCNLCSHGWLL